MKPSLNSVKLLTLVYICATSIWITKGQPSITRQIKNGLVNIKVQNEILVLDITKNDGTFMHNFLRIKNPGKPQGTLIIDINCGVDKVCVKNGNVTYTTITTSLKKETITISRNFPNPNGQIIDCYQLRNDTEWFGGPQLRYQYWPIQHMYYEEEPYVPTHPTNMAITERYWLSSKGIYIYVNENDPLFIDQNNYKDKYLCLIAKNKGPYRHRSSITLNYEIGLYKNPRLAHEYVVQNHFGKTKGHPNERMIKHPIWSTWAKYKVDINEKVIESFANEINAYGFNNSQIEIDDNWETCYGSAEFDTSKFPNIAKLIEKLKKKGFKVTLWIHPFINEGCEPAYTTALKNSYFVKNLKGEVHMSWWQGNNSATIDFTNPKAVQWWIARLKRIQQSGIDSLKFDAGEVSWLPQIPALTGPLDKQPGIFTYDYVNTLFKNFDDSIEARVGWRSQELPIFIRMIDKDSRWTWNNGLPTLITTLLQMNLNGYVHVLPDMIGGNGYGEYPSKELFIRWLQANVFMPSLQYSYVPWDYDNETVAISKKYTDLHANITPTILKWMRNSIKTGAPLNPPIWWVDPTNSEAHKINDEYLLGEDILVAPVVEEGVVYRDIYLPKGKWIDENTKIVYKGPTWIRDYHVPLNLLPYFRKADMSTFKSKKSSKSPNADCKKKSH